MKANNRKTGLVMVDTFVLLSIIIWNIAQTVRMKKAGITKEEGETKPKAHKKTQ